MLAPLLNEPDGGVFFYWVFLGLGTVFLGIPAIAKLGSWFNWGLEASLFCPHCKKYVSRTETQSRPWWCGYCEEKNTRYFLNYCQKCRRAPKAYKCPHCSELIFLNDDNDTEHFAYSKEDDSLVSTEEAKKIMSDPKVRRPPEVVDTLADAGKLHDEIKKFESKEIKDSKKGSAKKSLKEQIKEMYATGSEIATIQRKMHAKIDVREELSKYEKELEKERINKIIDKILKEQY